jgi:hypothetical protein
MFQSTQPTRHNNLNQNYGQFNLDTVVKINSLPLLHALTVSPACLIFIHANTSSGKNKHASESGLPAALPKKQMTSVCASIWTLASCAPQKLITDNQM